MSAEAVAARWAIARRSARTEASWVRIAVVAVAVLFLSLFVLLPVIVVFTEALRQGWTAYVAALAEPAAMAAIRLTLLVAAITVPLHIVFGLVMAWAIAKVGEVYPTRCAAARSTLRLVDHRPARLVMAS